jgi:hypothetical protein
LAKIFTCKKWVLQTYPLKGISPSRFRGTWEQLWVIFSKFFFMLPCSFILGVVTTLDLAHLDNLVLRYPKIGWVSHCTSDHLQNPALPSVAILLVLIDTSSAGICRIRHVRLRLGEVVQARRRFSFTTHYLEGSNISWC